MLDVTTSGKRLNAFGALAKLPLTVISATPAADQVLSNANADYQLRFSHPILATSIVASDFLVNSIPADSFQLINSSTLSFHFNTSPLSSEGLQTMQLVDGSVTRQFDLASSQPFTESFRFDSLPMQVVSSSLAPGQVDLELNEPIDPSSLSVSDLQVDRARRPPRRLIHTCFHHHRLMRSNLRISFAVGAHRSPANPRWLYSSTSNWTTPPPDAFTSCRDSPPRVGPAHRLRTDQRPRRMTPSHSPGRWPVAFFLQSWVLMA
jgi:hypothetical protein